MKMKGRRLQSRNIIHKSTSKARALTKAIALLIAVGLFPYSLVSDPAFNNLLHIAEPSYSIPNRTTFSRTIIPQLYFEEKKRIKNEILNDMSQGVTCLALTTDGWTSRAIESFISLTLHYITVNFVQKHFVLNVRNIIKSHSGENLYQLLKDILKEWDILSCTKNIVFVTDNGRNIVKAIKLGKKEDNWKRIPCFAHTLQLAIQDARKTCQKFQKLLKKCRKIVGYFARFSVARVKLKRIQKLMNPDSKPLVLIQNVKTRWNSEYAMLERLFLLKKPLNKLLKCKGMPAGLKKTEWALMEKYIHTLEPLKEATELMSGDSYPTSSSYIPIITGIENALKEIIKNKKEMTLGSNLLKSVQKRFKFTKTHETLKLASMLDPRFKDCYFAEQSKRKMKKTLIEIASSVSINDSHPRMPSGEPKCKIKKFFEEKCNKYKSTINTKEEINLYLQEPTQSFNTEPIAWWINNQHRFPCLAVLAKHYLCIPATQASSERLFSTTGNIVTAQRCAISPDHMEEVCFLHHNAQF